MKKKWKILSICVAAAALVAALVIVGVASLVSPTKLPSGVSTTTPPMTSLTRTTTVPKPTPSTVTVTITPPVWPTETAKTITPQPQPQGCEQDDVDTSGWNTDPDTNTINPAFVGPLAPPFASTGDCFDKLVFDVQTGTGVEFSAEYVPVVIADGSGLPVTDIKGSKFIQLTIRATMLRDEEGNPLYNAADYNIPDAYGFGNLRELRLVTPDYEGYTTFGIGVDTMTPFAVESHVVGEGMTEVVVYITRPHR